LEIKIREMSMTNMVLMVSKRVVLVDRTWEIFSVKCSEWAVVSNKVAPRKANL